MKLGNRERPLGQRRPPRPHVNNACRRRCGLILAAHRRLRFYETDARVGGPDWLSSERFDIVARAGEIPASLNPSTAVRLMLRTLLSERFALVIHQEQRVMPIYALTLARRDGSLGRQLQRSVMDCAAIATGRAASGAAVNNDGRPRCGWHQKSSRAKGGRKPTKTPALCDSYSLRLCSPAQRRHH